MVYLRARTWMGFPSSSRCVTWRGYVSVRMGPRVDLVHDESIPEGRRVCVVPEHFFIVSCFSVSSSSAAVDQHRREPATFCTCPENYYASVDILSNDWTCQECPVGYSFIKNGSVNPDRERWERHVRLQGWLLPRQHRAQLQHVCAPGMTSAGGRVTECSAIPNSDARNRRHHDHHRRRLCHPHFHIQRHVRRHGLLSDRSGGVGRGRRGGGGMIMAVGVEVGLFCTL